MYPFATHTWLSLNAQNVLIGLEVDVYSSDKNLDIDSPGARGADDPLDTIRELSEKCVNFDALLETIRNGGRLEYMTIAEGRTRAKLMGESATPVAPATVVIHMLGGCITSLKHNLEQVPQFVILDHGSDSDSERDEAILLDGNRIDSEVSSGDFDPQTCAEILELAQAAAKAAARAALTNSITGWEHEHPDHPLSDWRLEVRDQNTHLGYDAWLEHQLDALKATQADPTPN